eukprot:NODE_17801_length_925_cov_4.796992.p1 GENE.NODE_17801_length_925_cov_4.796992~~NODE_17801_length_925_cov_4.796992.p1  ORF type:complete len:225 (-),score=41.79 NODE_17801_length_925_cov_4.796992:149-823(-)
MCIRGSINAEYMGAQAFLSQSRRHGVTSKAGLTPTMLIGADEPPPVVHEIRQLPGNARCADCGTGFSTDPLVGDPWVSVSHGTVICIQCAGVHRSFGVHISFVRSLMLDTLKEREVSAMKQGGNERLLAFVEAAEEGMVRGAWKELPLSSRYHTPVADAYRQHLRALVDIDVPLSTVKKPVAYVPAAPLPPPPRRPAEKSGGGACSRLCCFSFLQSSRSVARSH